MMWCRNTRFLLASLGFVSYLFLSVSSIFAEPIEHSILLKTTKADELAAKAVAVEPSPAQTGNKWALIVAVNKCDDRTIPPLRYCRRDAILIANSLESVGGYDPSRVFVLHDGEHEPSLQATSGNINRRLLDLLRRVQPNDSLLLFFSGHGYPTEHSGLFFASSDCQKRDIASTGFSFSKLRQLLENKSLCRAKQKLLILDTCHAGAAKSTYGLPTGEVVAQSFAKARGFITIASSGSNQYSYEWPERKQGVFTYYLAKGLQGPADDNHDGLVDSSELYHYVALRVPGTVSELESGAVQEPRRMIGEDVVGSFPVAKRDITAHISRLVERKRRGLFRVEMQQNDDWNLVGTAFAVNRFDNRVFLATATTVLNDHRGRVLGEGAYRFHNQVNPNKIYRAERIYRDRDMPKVAIVELRLDSRFDVPELFNLLPYGEARHPMSAAALLGYTPGGAPCGLYITCYQPGILSASTAHPMGSYQFRSDNPKDILPGAPLFVVGDRSGGARDKQESVLGICLGDREGDDQIAVSISSLHMLIEKIRKTDNVPLPHSEGLLARVDYQGETRITPETDLSITSHDEIMVLLDVAVREASELGKRGNYRQAARVMRTARSRYEEYARDSQRLDAAVPWEFDALEGCVLTHSALALFNNGRRAQAMPILTQARVRFDNAFMEASGQIAPLLLGFRVENNLGTPLPGAKLDANQRRHLSLVHDTVLALIQEDNRHGNLTDRQRAQCQYLLGYSHKFLGKECKGDPKANFRKSYEHFPSVQVQRQLRHLKVPLNNPAPNVADIWNEFDTLLETWEQRSSTSCPDCNAGCSVCS